MKTDTYTPNYKIGDKFSCIKNCTHNDSNYIKNDIYTVTQVSYELGICFYKINHIWYGDVKNIPIHSNLVPYKLHENFIQLKELRQQKLEKINAAR